MGATLLSILVALEAALLGFSLITKSRQEKTRSIVRVAAFIVFGLLVATSVIQWSFRWYALALLLFAWGAMATWALVRRNEPTRAYQTRDVIFKAAVAIMLLLLAIVPALIFPQYQLPAATGPYAVADARYTYIDESRAETYADTGEARKVNVAFWYPADAQGVHPLVVFSHGGLGIDTSNVYLFRELASHGYVVASLGHPYHSFWTRDVDGQVTFLNMDYARELQQEDPRTDKLQSHAYYQKWMKIRMGDIDFALDSILGQATNGAPGVYRLVDAERIGVMGHSLGGSAALGIGRQRDDIDAVLALESPLMFDIVGVENDEFVLIQDAYPVPVLNIYSDNAWGNLAEWEQYGANHALLTDGRETVDNIHISGLSHLALTDLSLTSPILVRLLDGDELTRDSLEGLGLINEVSLRFFDSYLKGPG